MKGVLATRFTQACRWGGIAALGVGYAVLSHLAAASATPGLLEALVAVLPLLGLAFVLAWRSPQRTTMLALCGVACFGFYIARQWLITHYNWVFLLQHAGMYALLCGTFGRTLVQGQTPMISQFARIVHGELSPALVSYTRSVTWAWALYFGSVAGLSLLLFWLAPVYVWSTFANLLGMPLLGLMFAGEYLVRCHTLPVEDRAGPLESIRAYRQASAENRARRP
ncbi:MAG: hypothetical protein ABIR76_14595 [Polaromonas sp.]